MPFLDCVRHSPFYATVDVRYLYPNMSCSIFHASFSVTLIDTRCAIIVCVFAIRFEILFRALEILKRSRTSTNCPQELIMIDFRCSSYSLLVTSKAQLKMTRLTAFSGSKTIDKSQADSILQRPTNLSRERTLPFPLATKSLFNDLHLLPSFPLKVFRS